MSNKKFETLDGINSPGDVTISGNFAVNSNALFVNSSEKRVGIGKTNPTTDLDVDGNITATNVNAQFFGNGSNIANVNAVTLGSLAETQFLRSDVADTFTGTSLTVQNSNTSFQSTAKVNLFNGTPLRFGTLPNPSATLTFANTGAQTGKLELITSGTIDVIIDNALTVTGAVTATQFSGGSSNLSAVTTSANGVMTAADKTKLNGIETSATADQTAAEIRSLVESATDSNVFTDADHTKLNGIADNAQVNVATNLSTSVNTTVVVVESSTGNNATLPSASPSHAGVMTAADKSKLNGIATGAQTGTVTSVGTGFGLVDNGPITISGQVSLTSITAGSTAHGALRYNSTVRSAGRLYGGTTNPSSTTRLNYDGILHATDVIATSDRELKKDIADLPSEVCLNIVNSLRPRSYRWKEDNREDHGLIAQEAQEFVPLQTPNGTSINYAKLTTYLLGAVQAQQKTIETLNERIQKLEESE